MDTTTFLYGEDFPDEILTDTHLHVPGLEPMPLEHEAWQAWARQMLVHREQIANQCAVRPSARVAFKALCAQPYGLGQIYFAVTFAWIYEPREDDDLAMVPMILFPRQALLLLARDACMRRPKGQFSSMAVPKSRGVGATWMAALDQVARWAFRKNFQGRFVSRNEDLVDAVGDSDAFFWKCDYITKHVPEWLMPRGYTHERNGTTRTHMKIINPVTGSAIIGEATTSGIGVAKRATVYDIDEASRMRDLNGIYGQLNETTNHRIVTSTHNLEFNEHFWNMTHGIKEWEGLSPVIFPMAWDSVPGRDEEWLEATRRSMTKELFEREVMMNPHAGISSWVYPLARTMHPKPDTFWVPSAGLGLTGLDDGYDDDFALLFTQWDRNDRRFKVLDAYQSSDQPLSYYGCLLRGIPDGRFPWDYEALRIMSWIRTHALWQNIHLGDRHGDNTDLTSGVSPWQKMQTEFGITVHNSSHIANDHKSRQDAAKDLLTMTDFATTPGALAALEALQHNRRPEPKEGSSVAFEHKKPIHDGTSHLTTTFEYLAIYVMETFVGRTYGIASTGKALEPISNGWLGAAREDSLYGRSRMRGVKERKGSNNGWIR